MTKYTKMIQVANWVILFLFLLTLSLTLNGAIAFGLGLGDLMFIVIIGAVCIVLTVFNVLGLNTITKLVQLLISFLILTYIVYSFSIGRGPENPWNGKIFI